MNSVYLNRENIMALLEFMDSFPDSYKLELKHASNEIGDVIIADLHGVKINGHVVTVSKTIVDETDW